MNDEAMAALRAAIEADPELRERFAQAGTEADLLAVAGDAWLDLTPLTSVEGDLSDLELESVTGGYTFPPTDWIYCDNPWTNAWCTLKC